MRCQNPIQPHAMTIYMLQLAKGGNLASRIERLKRTTTQLCIRDWLNPCSRDVLILTDIVYSNIRTHVLLYFLEILVNPRWKRDACLGGGLGRASMVVRDSCLGGGLGRASMVVRDLCLGGGLGRASMVVNEYLPMFRNE